MGLWENIKNIMTIPEDDEEIEEEAVESKKQDYVKREYDEEEKPLKQMPKIIKTKNTAGQQLDQMQVVLVKPERFEDVTSIADHLNEKRTVVLNLESANREVSRRIVDFLSGAAYANHGNMRKVANNTFIIAAHGVDVLGELMFDDFDESKLYY